MCVSCIKNLCLSIERQLSVHVTSGMPVTIVKLLKVREAAPKQYYVFQHNKEDDYDEKDDNDPYDTE